LNGNCQEVGFESAGISPAQEIAETAIHSQFAAVRGIAKGNAYRQGKQEIGKIYHL
jgi:hypothetical protein